MGDRWGSLNNSARPAFSVNGIFCPELTVQLQAMSTVETYDTLEFEGTFNNWGQVAGVPDYLFSANPLIDLGKQFQIKIGTTILFTATITTISSIHPTGSTPSISIVAKGVPSRRRALKSWFVSYGVSLREITLCYFLGNIKGNATAEVNGSLHVGEKVTTNGVGGRFGGEYTVTEVSHLFDTQQGLRTEFMVSRTL